MYRRWNHLGEWVKRHINTWECCIGEIRNDGSCKNSRKYANKQEKEMEFSVWKR